MYMRAESRTCLRILVPSPLPNRAPVQVKLIDTTKEVERSLLEYNLICPILFQTYIRPTILTFRNRIFF